MLCSLVLVVMKFIKKTIKFKLENVVVILFSTDTIVATHCISAHVFYFLSVLCFMSSNVVCSQDQLPLHPSLLVTVRVVV